MPGSVRPSAFLESSPYRFACPSLLLVSGVTNLELFVAPTREFCRTNAWEFWRTNDFEFCRLPTVSVSYYFSTSLELRCLLSKVFMRVTIFFVPCFLSSGPLSSWAGKLLRSFLFEAPVFWRLIFTWLMRVDLFDWSICRLMKFLVSTEKFRLTFLSRSGLFSISGSAESRLRFFTSSSLRFDTIDS
jgi:hypothetical protein